MSILEILSLVCSGALTAAGATWALRSKLSEIQTALSTHVAKNEMEHFQLDARILKLEAPARRKR